MTSRFAAMKASTSACAGAARLALVGAALGLIWTAASAQPSAQPNAPAPPMLEREFWRGDYAATTRLLDAGAAAVEGLRGRLEALTASQIQVVYLNCSNQAMKRRLDGGEAAMCSLAYDVLLKRHFGGNFDALLAWSRQQAGVGDQSQADGMAMRPDGSRPAEQRRLRPACEI